MCAHSNLVPASVPQHKSAPCLNCGVGTGLRDVLTGIYISAQRVVSLGTVPMGTKCEQNLKGNGRNSCFCSSLISVMIERSCN